MISRVDALFFDLIFQVADGHSRRDSDRKCGGISFNKAPKFDGHIGHFHLQTEWGGMRSRVRDIVCGVAIYSAIAHVTRISPPRTD